MNKKSLFGLFLFSILLASLILSANLVLAQPVPDRIYDLTTEKYGDKIKITQISANNYDIYEIGGRKIGTVGIGSNEEVNFNEIKYNDPISSSWVDNFKRLAFVDLWLKGYSSANFNIAGTFVKTMLLLLLIILVFSSMTYANFMYGGLRFLVSVIVGILATFLISTEALLTSLTSFTALGTAIWIFLPILILTFFTIMVSASAAPFGILIQKILWVAYSVYTFLSGIVIFSLAQAKSGNAVAKFFNDWIVQPLYGNNSTLLEGMKANADATTAVLLVVVSIFVFIIAVVKGDFLSHWLAKEKMDAELMKFEDSVERQAAKRRIEAEDTKSKKE